MGSSEPSLVPEWLKSNGSASGGGRIGHHSASSNSQTDAASRNKSFRSIGESDSPRTHSDHSSSYNLRRSSVNNIISSKHSYSSFSRNNRDNNLDREKERTAFGEIWDHGCFEPRGKEALRRSHSTISRKQDLLLPRRVASAFTNFDRSKHSFRKDLHDQEISKSVKKAEFERDIPVIPVNEKQGVPDSARGASPGVTAAASGLPNGSSALVGEGWSALAEVPAVFGTDNVGSSLDHQPLEVSSACVVSSLGTSMAEGPAQSPGTTCTASQAFIEAQKLEQIAIKQYRQLIPMTPVLPKPMATSSADKFKLKMALRNGDSSSSSKIGMHSQASGSAYLASQSLRNAQIMHESSKASQIGKFYVLRPPWENSTPVHKDSSALAYDVGNTGIDTLPAPASSTASSSNANSSRAVFMESKAAASSQNVPAVGEKKHMFSHAQTRNEFFNLVRKKASMNSSLCAEASAVPVEQSNEVGKETMATTLSSEGFEKGDSNCIGDAHEVDQKSTNKEDYSVSTTEVIPDEEEEAEFLRSLGWEEYGSENDGLTDEEINSFYQEVMKLRSTLKLCEAVQPKASLLHKLMLVEVHPD